MILMLFYIYISSNKNLHLNIAILKTGNLVPYLPIPVKTIIPYNFL